MALLSLLEVDLSFGGPALLHAVNFQVNQGERVCLVGRNGAGKSTLMKVIMGELKPDTGEVFREPGAIFSRLNQDIPTDIDGTVHDIVASGLRPLREHEEEWEKDVLLEDLVDKLQLKPQAQFSQLSGGLKRRVLLGRALAGQPDLLLLDEPTNHLDIDSILWLEKFLLTETPTLLFVTHDRAFLRKLATRIVELDRGRLAGWACDYDTYLVRKQEVLEAEERQQAVFDKKLAQEEAWIRRGVRAQRSRAQSRIHALMEMRAAKRARRERQGNVTLKMTEAERSGAKVIEVENMSFAYPNGQVLVRDLTLTVMRGDKIGLIGPNGAGKSTLIKLLLGEQKPTSGAIEQGTNLEVVYFDQLRALIDDTKTVADNIANGNQNVTINGHTRHVISYLQDFLFTPDRARTPARVLSGGERNRLLLARLFTKPANFLVLDEPTNDLDAETLDLLEDLLVEFDGTLLVVSHDREFLDNVVSSTLVFEGDGKINEYVGGYADWVRQKDKDVAAEAVRLSNVAGVSATIVAPPKALTKPKKLTNKERQELDQLPKSIEKLEAEQKRLTEKMSDPEFYKKQAAEASIVRARLETIESELSQAMARWEFLGG